jgi:hypothetical protein
MMIIDRQFDLYLDDLYYIETSIGEVSFSMVLMWSLLSL